MSAEPPLLVAALRDATRLAAAAAAAANEGGVLAAGLVGGVLCPMSDTRRDMALLPVLEVGEVIDCDGDAVEIVRPKAD